MKSIIDLAYEAFRAKAQTFGVFWPPTLDECVEPFQAAFKAAIDSLTEGVQS